MRYIKKFVDCFFIKGEKRAVIYDVNRKKYEFIPLSMVDFITRIENQRETILDELAMEYGDSDGVKNYMDYLEENEYIFYCDKDELAFFPELSTSFKTPSWFTNAVFLLDSLDTINWDIVKTKLEEVNCSHIQVYLSNLTKQLSLEDLNSWFTYFEKSRIRSIEFLIPAERCKIEKEEWESFCERHKRLKSLINYSSATSTHLTYGKYGMGNIVYINEKIQLTNEISMVHPYYFNVNIDAYVEAQHHNLFYNKKLIVNNNGDIVDCFSATAKTFGLIERTNLKKLSEDEDYTRFWSINKDQIEECCSCEFRYMCADNREPIISDNGEITFKDKCNYNPKLLSWNFNYDLQMV